jgi:hypothetical protein
MGRTARCGLHFYLHDEAKQNNNNERWSEEGMWEGGPNKLAAYNTHLLCEAKNASTERVLMQLSKSA